MPERTAGTATPSPQQSATPVEAHPLPVIYTNYFRASGSAEELLLDFGLDPHRRTDDALEPIVVFQRLILTWNNARRLAVMLNELVQMHDRAHSLRSPDDASRPPTPPLSSPQT